MYTSKITWSFLWIVLFALPAYAGFGPQSTPEPPLALSDIADEQLTSLDADAVAIQLGRDLSRAECRQLRRARRIQQRHPDLSPRQALDAVRPMNGMAIAGFVLSLAGFVFFDLLLIGAVLGTVFSIIALSQIKRSDKAPRGRGLAIAGLVLGILGLCSLVLILGAG